MLSSSDIAKILAPVWVQFPRRENKREHIALWHRLFRNVPYRALERAVILCLAHSKFEPTVADVREMLVEMQGRRIEPVQAFGLLRRAVQRFGYYQEERAMKALPSNVAQAARSMGWKEICMSENPEALRAHFMKAFEGVQKRGELQKTIKAVQEHGLLVAGGEQDRKGLEHVSEVIGKRLEELA